MSQTGDNMYNYLCDGLNIKVGDKVIVLFGKNNEEAEGVVVVVGKRYTSSFCFDFKYIKKILRKK